ncbi:CLAVATA3/ESR (CLE)-related protein 25 [Linum perenne]
MVKVVGMEGTGGRMGKGSSRIFRVISLSVLLLGVILFLYVGVVASHAPNGKLAGSSSGKHHFPGDLDLNYVSKRRVPNGPDPIHNRKASQSRQSPGRRT